MTERIKDFLFEPHWSKPMFGLGGWLTSKLIHDALQWLVLIGSAFLICTQVTTWLVRHFICRARDGRGPCDACGCFRSWMCPGPRATTKNERIEDKYD
jgi:hypothetical protein